MKDLDWSDVEADAALMNATLCVTCGGDHEDPMDEIKWGFGHPFTPLNQTRTLSDPESYAGKDL